MNFTSNIVNKIRHGVYTIFLIWFTFFFFLFSRSPSIQICKRSALQTQMQRRLWRRKKKENRKRKNGELNSTLQILCIQNKCETISGVLCHVFNGFGRRHVYITKHSKLRCRCCRHRRMPFSKQQQQQNKCILL